MKRIIVAIMAAFGLVLGIFGSANAADGSNVVTPVNGEAWVYTSTYVDINVLTDEQVSAGDDVCRPSMDQMDGMAFTDSGYIGLFMNEDFADNPAVLKYRICPSDVDASEGAVQTIGVHSRTARYVTHKRAKRKTVHHKYKHTLRNPNVSDEHLNGDVECLYGSFNRPSPDGSVVVPAESSKKVRSKRKHLDFLCYTVEEFAYAGASNDIGSSSRHSMVAPTHKPSHNKPAWRR